MLAIRSLFYWLLRFPLKVLVHCKVIPNDVLKTVEHTENKPIFYILPHQSASDLLALQQACLAKNLPDPFSHVDINGKSYRRTLCIDKPNTLFKFSKRASTTALQQGLDLLATQKKDSSLDIQLIPVNLTWARSAAKEKDNPSIASLLAEQQSPSWLRKFFIVLFLGRHTWVRFSKAFSFQNLVEQHGSDEQTAHKLLRVARFHFYRQTIAATGPRLMHRQQMIATLMKNPAIEKLIADEVKNKGTDEAKVKKEALALMDEIASDYRESMIRFGDRILTWLWNRLYRGIEVNHAGRLRDLAQEGHEIIYVPCHRSHMDYLLLMYVIHHQGLVTPRVAAGINLNFWPAGPLFRKAGAFFIRRSFRGNRLYSTIFREYLSLLFDRGYSVKYYTEGGRSRTGRLLTPKTGMLAMTIQSLLRGVDRPLTLVPVYLGYEHVMEVATYHKELSGSKKQKESIFGVFKAIKSLRNYGKGFVNFGQPININQFLNQQVPDWKDAIDPIDPQKPSWLTPSVNLLGNKVMTEINRSVALNGTALIALILHASENKALSKRDLADKIDFFLDIQKQSPYSNEIIIPEQSGDPLLDHVIELNKVTVTEDSLGSVISLDEKAALEMSYYRNNILHAYLLPALVCRLLDNSTTMENATLLDNIKELVNIIRPEFFLWQQDADVESQVRSVLTTLETKQIISQPSEGFWTVTDDINLRSNLRLMSECAESTVQRLVMVSQLVNQHAPITKSALEESMVAIAKRLSVLNNIHAPEFTDKKAQSSLVNHLKSLGYITVNEDNHFISNEQLIALNSMVQPLVDLKVLQTISE